MFCAVVKSIFDFVNKDEKAEDILKKPSKYVLPPTIKTDKGSFLWIGDDAKDKLVEFYKEVIEVLKCKRVISLDDLASIVDPLFANHVFNEGEKLADISQVVQRIEQKVDEGCKDTKIIVPFISSASGHTQQELWVGDVRVIGRDVLKDEFTNPMRQLKDDVYQQEFDETAEYYDRFLWHIVVPVRGVYSDSMAEGLAIDTANLILNMFHMRFSLGHSDRMAVGFDLPTESMSAVIRVLDNNKITFEQRFQMGLGNVGLPDDFLSMFKGDYQEMCSIIGKVANLMLDVRKSYPFNERLVDALYWYGDAIREKNSAVSTVKFITSLERLLTFDEHGSLKERICNRAIAIIRHGGFKEESSLPQLKKSLARVYKLRSDILHGSVSPTDSEVGMKMEQIEDLTNCVLHGYAHILRDKLISKGPEIGLKKWFIDLVKHYRIDDLPITDE
jgi:hypothetical protein